MRRVLLFLCLPAFAQWPAIPSKDIPRLPDGKPNLEAPAPKTADGKPDLTGLWDMDMAAAPFQTVMTDEEGAKLMKPETAALVATRRQRFATDGPTARCLPVGIARAYPGVWRVVQSQELMVVLYGLNPPREIFLDGRALPADPSPTWLGYSTGHWERDELVVETRGFNGKAWLDVYGHPLSEQARVVERFQRSSFGHMDVQITVDDPGAYSAPFQIKHAFDIFVDKPIANEVVCNEDNSSLQHMLK